ncbi:MOR1 isoform X1 [Tanacetum coccineum]
MKLLVVGVRLGTSNSTSTTFPMSCIFTKVTGKTSNPTAMEQVQQQVIEVVSHIASTATKFPMKCVVLCIAGICERVADIKTCAQAMKCLTTFSEAMGTELTTICHQCTGET